MTADPLAEVLADHQMIDTYTGVACVCGEQFLGSTLLTVNRTTWFMAHVADAVRAFLAEHFAKPEVVEAVASVIDSRTGSHMGVAHWHPTTRAALAALLETLGGESNE